MTIFVTELIRPETSEAPSTSELVDKDEYFCTEIKYDYTESDKWFEVLIDGLMKDYTEWTPWSKCEREGC